jgi:hypothetical protein
MNRRIECAVHLIEQLGFEQRLSRERIKSRCRRVILLAAKFCCRSGQGPGSICWAGLKRFECTSERIEGGPF